MRKRSHAEIGQSCQEEEEKKMPRTQTLALFQRSRQVSREELHLSQAGLPKSKVTRTSPRPRPPPILLSGLPRPPPGNPDTSTFPGKKGYLFLQPASRRLWKKRLFFFFLHGFFYLFPFPTCSLISTKTSCEAGRKRRRKSSKMNHFSSWNQHVQPRIYAGNSPRMRQREREREREEEEKKSNTHT